MSKELIRTKESVLSEFTEEQLSLIKSQIAPQANNDELKLFLYTARSRGLDPLAKQIYCIHRQSWNPERGQTELKMTIQTAIDGLRSIAERTGNYAPGDETWVDGEDGKPVSSTVTVQKLVQGSWKTFSATAHFVEYAQAFKDKKTGDMKLGGQWAKMPHVMIAKCAEAKALRKGWPEQLSGLYTSDEMQQADSSSPEVIERTKTWDALPIEAPKEKEINPDVDEPPDGMAKELASFCAKHPKLKEFMGISFTDLPFAALNTIGDVMRKGVEKTEGTKRKWYEYHIEGLLFELDERAALDGPMKPTEA